MRTILAIVTIVFFFNLSAKAQFSNYYSAGNWSASSTSNGTVDSSNKPTSVKIVGSDGNKVNAITSFTMPSLATGSWSFTWNYSTTDDPSTDQAYVSINGVRSLLTSDVGGQIQSGNYTGVINAGDVFGWGIDATDDCCGNGILTISNFVPPGGVLQKSTNANLSALSLSAATLAPAFASATTGYSASVSNTTSSITVKPTVADATATVTVNGVVVTSGNASGAIALNVGSNTITTAVTAGDGTTTKTYTITVTRAASSNANLSNLSISSGTLTPVFASGTTSYTASVANSITSVSLTPTVADATATVTVNGVVVTSGNASGAIALNVGSNTITTAVTAGDGTTTKTYTITVIRAASSNANLSNLSISSGTLAPVFTSGTTSYTASVANSVTSLTITPTVSDATATVTVNGVAVTSGNASGAIALNVGSNTITTAVTAGDGTTTKTYTITVTRAASSNANLSNLSISSGTLTPIFASGTTSYTASVANSITSLTITPTVADATATVTVNETAVTSGSASSIPLSVGSNTIAVVVSSQDGTKNTYTLTITREISTPSVPNLTKSTDLGMSDTDNITSNSTPVFVGSADPDATIFLYDGSLEIGSAIADNSGAWAITTSELGDGIHLITSKATLNGLESELSNALSVTIDKEAPAVNLISRLNPDTTTTTATTIAYRITFSEKVSEITVSDLTLTTSGLVSGIISSVSSDTGTVIDVTVSNIEGEGQLGLKVNDNTGITDIAGNTALGSYTNSEEYTIVASSTLPVTLTDFKAYGKGNEVQVTWKATAEINVKRYEIEKSAGGRSFMKAGEVLSRENGISTIYKWTDNHPEHGNNFYKLKIIDKDGTAKYSETRLVVFNDDANYLKVNPNPVTDKTLKLTMGNMAPGKYELALYDNKGQRVFSSSIDHNGESAAKIIQLPTLLTTGIYNLHLSNHNLVINKVIIIMK
ncbi:cadherin-like beta sandwich domain-containing protein [Segetibacter koreensis]|uniref:cadherin-like beta sandwich domain-containing protein n=1 Tax=Segetibacter koreensis TaxID=398037 RepID=UPI0003625669|nr:cadherin-like beta sandwich domain-containing protein [Segetibacter koreensis]